MCLLSRLVPLTRVSQSGTLGMSTTSTTLLFLLTLTTFTVMAGKLHPEDARPTRGLQGGPTGPPEAEVGLMQPSVRAIAASHGHLCGLGEVWSRPRGECVQVET